VPTTCEDAPVWPGAFDPATVGAAAERNASKRDGREREWSTTVTSGLFM
jgi:hypothetical protein